MRTHNTNVVEFAQTVSCTKKFRHDYPIPEPLKKLLLIDIYHDFTGFVLSQYLSEAQPFIDEFLSFHPTQSNKKFSLEQNLFWWYVLYQNSVNDEMNVIDQYVLENKMKYRKKQIIPAWLNEWGKAVPKFYLIRSKHDQQKYIIEDILNRKEVEVSLNNEDFYFHEGALVAGILIPIGNSVYFPVVDFYNFTYETSVEILTHILFYYKNYYDTTTSAYQLFLHLFSAALQIENQIIEKTNEQA